MTRQMPRNWVWAACISVIPLEIATIAAPISPVEGAALRSFAFFVFASLSANASTTWNTCVRCYQSFGVNGMGVTMKMVHPRMVASNFGRQGNPRAGFRRQAAKKE